MIIGEPFSRKLKLNTGSILDLILQIQWQISTVKSKSLDNGTSWHTRHCTCNPVNRCHGCNRATPHIYVLALLFCFWCHPTWSFNYNFSILFLQDVANGSFHRVHVCVLHLCGALRCDCQRSTGASFLQLLFNRATGVKKVTSHTPLPDRHKVCTSNKNENTDEKWGHTGQRASGSKFFKISFLLQSICSLQTSVGLQNHL